MLALLALIDLALAVVDFFEALPRRVARAGRAMRSARRRLRRE